MASQRIGSNPNYKIYGRLRPSEYSSNMLEITSDFQSLAIKDPSMKQSQKQYFSFNHIFDQNIDQQTIWSYLGDPCVTRALEGHNSIILSYGQTGSGKTYTVFGEDRKFGLQQEIRHDKDRKGLIFKVMDNLFMKESELADIRDFQIQVSCCEIYLDKVRDLGMDKAQWTTYLTQDLQIYENTDGAIVVKDLTQQDIKNIEDLENFVQSCFQLRNEYNKPEIWYRAHTIVTFTITQKDQENNNVPFLKSSIQFVDLAGSERIAKQIGEGYKFQEAILINNNLTSLGKCLNNISKYNKNIGYGDSKLTKVLQNCLSIGSSVMLMINLNPSESNYEECLSSLQYMERSRNSQKTSIGPNAPAANSIINSSNVNLNEDQQQFVPLETQKQDKKLQEENQELKNKLEFMYRDFKNKLLELQNILGIEQDLEKLLHNKSNQKELNQFKAQKEALIKSENLMRQIQDQENKLQKIHKKLDEKNKEDNLKQERHSCQVLELRQTIQNLKNEIVTSKMAYEEEMRKMNREKQGQISQILQKNQNLVDEKMNVVGQISQNFINKTNENQKFNDFKTKTKIDQDKDLKNKLEIQKQEHEQIIKNLKQQYEQFLRNKNDEIEIYVDKVQEFQDKKNGKLDDYSNEILFLYQIVDKQNLIIEKVETGQYTGGLKSINIPNRDKPQKINRDKCPVLFDLLDRSQIKKFHLSDQLSKIKSKTTDTRRNQDLIDINFNLQQFKNEKDFLSLKQYADRLKSIIENKSQEINELQNKLNQFTVVNENLDIQKVYRESSMYKSKFLKQQKEISINKQKIDYYKRQLLYKRITDSKRSGDVLIRPSTGLYKGHTISLQQQQQSQYKM